MPFNKAVLLAFLILIFSCSSHKVSSKEDHLSSSFYPFILNEVQVTCIDTTFRVIGMTRTIPPTEITEIDSFVYEIRLVLGFGLPDMEWDKPFGVMVEPPRKTPIEYIFNTEGYPINNREYNEYYIEMLVKEKGEGRLTLTFPYEANSTFHYDIYNPFQSKRIKFE